MKGFLEFTKTDLAILNGHLEIVRELLQKNAGITSQICIIRVDTKIVPYQKTYH